MIEQYISEAGLYEMLAEEASELAAAALKMSRVLREESPTPITREEATAHVNEEAGDVANCLDLLLIPNLQHDRIAKIKRMCDRLADHHDLDEDEYKNLYLDCLGRIN